MPGVQSLRGHGHFDQTSLLIARFRRIFSRDESRLALNPTPLHPEPEGLPD